MNAENEGNMNKATNVYRHCEMLRQRNPHMDCKTHTHTLTLKEIRKVMEKREFRQ